VFAASCGGGGGGGGGEDLVPLHPDMVAANVYEGPIPDSAIPISPTELAAGLTDGSLHLLTLAERARQEQEAEAQLARDRARAEELYAATPDLLARLTAEPDPSDDSLEMRPDGNWLVHVPGDAGRQERSLPLYGKRLTYAGLVRAAEVEPTRENQVGLYGSLFERLTPEFISRHGLPDPDDVGPYSVAEVKTEIQKIGTAWSTLLLASGGKPPGYPAGAWTEEGHGGNDGAAYGPHTGMWPLIDFPLKWCVTSIKDQGTRWTNTAFAITGAVEAIVARDQGRWTNLSEQTLYCKATQEWSPLVGTKLSVASVLEDMSGYDKLDPTFVYPWESSWDYNRSPARIVVGSSIAWWYERSCWGTDTLPSYAGEYCSDAIHQAPLYNAPSQHGGTYLAHLKPVPVPPDARFRVVGSQCLTGGGSLSLELVRAALLLKIPVIASVAAPYNMRSDHMDGSGILPYPPYGSIGTHCLLLVGYVPNAHLPPGTPPGSGGGYFVCKNSWGTDYGDGGYCYASDDWLLSRTWGCYVVDVVEVSP
jgi:hypothetical protein